MRDEDIKQRFVVVLISKQKPQEDPHNMCTGDTANKKVQVRRHRDL